MTTRTYDFDLHGIVGIRLLDATDGDIARVTRQLGPLDAELARMPDITVRFVDRLTTGPLTFVGVGDTGFDAEHFYVLRGRGGAAAKARFPFDEVGRALEIVCERAMPSIPHLLTCINMAALTRGVLPLHASAFHEDGRGILVMGWAKGGKTETLLARMERGAEYIGDEWIYLTPDGTMRGLPEPIRLWAWHLDQQPRVLAARDFGERRRVALWGRLASAAGHVAEVAIPGAGLARRAKPLLQRQAFLQIPPAQLFGDERLRLRGHLDAAVLMLSHEGDEINASRVEPTEIAGRMAASLTHEREQFLDHYRQFRFAFPGRGSDAVEGAPDTESQLLRAIFDGRPAAKVSHPYPCDLSELGDAVVRAADDLLSREQASQEACA